MNLLKKYSLNVFDIVIDGLILVLRDATKYLNEKYPTESKEQFPPDWIDQESSIRPYDSIIK